MERKEIDNILSKYVSESDTRDLLTSRLLDLFHGELDVQKNLLDSERQKLTALEESNKQLQSEYDSAIRNSENVEALKSQISTLKSNQKQELARIQKEYDDRLIQSAIETELTKAGAKNTKAAAALLDSSVLQLVDGNVLGLTEMVNKIKNDETTSFLFEAPEQPVVHNYVPQGSVEKPQTDAVDSLYESVQRGQSPQETIKGW